MLGSREQITADLSPKTRNQNHCVYLLTKKLLLPNVCSKHSFDFRDDIANKCSLVVTAVTIAKIQPTTVVPGNSETLGRVVNIS